MLTLRQAQSIVAAAESKAAAIGVAVNIAVLDSGTHLKAFTRMDGAVLGSIDIAVKKARTAALFETTSDAVWAYCAPGAPAHALEHTNGGLAPFAGGLPVRDPSGLVIGALGISGGSVAQDAEIAAAGLAALPG